MGEAGIGWIAAIIIGGIAGWIASNFMNSNTGIFMNIILGIIGAAVASFIFGFLGVSFGGWRLSGCRVYRRLHPDMARPRDRRVISKPITNQNPALRRVFLF